MQIDTSSVTESDYLAAAPVTYLPTGLDPHSVPAESGDPPPKGVGDTERVAVGGPMHAWLDEWAFPLAKSLRRAVERHGDAACEWMMLDAKVKGSVSTLLQTVLADGIKLDPRVEEELNELGLPVDPAQQTLAERSREVTDFCLRSLRRLDPTPEEFTAQMLRGAMVKRCMLAEKVLDHVSYGPDAGKKHLGTLAVLPRSHWAFAVDDYGEVVGYEVETEAGRERLGKGHFVQFSWCPQDGDPGGTFLLDAAFVPWEFKARLWARYFDFTDEFAAPSLVATTPEGAKPRLPRDPDTGEVMTGARPVSAEADLLGALKKFRSMRIIVSPAGTEIHPLEVKGNGEAYLSAFGVCDQEIVFAICQVTRATLESQHGSRADSQTAQDVLGVLVKFIKMLAAAMWEREILYPLVELNFGREAADLHTPEVTLGATAREDFAAAAGAIASLFNCGPNAPVTWSDRQRVLNFLGLPYSKFAKPMWQIQLEMARQQAAIVAPAAGPAPSPAP